MDKREYSVYPKKTPQNGNLDEHAILKEEMATYMADIKADSELYEKTKQRVVSSQSLNKATGQKKRPVSFYLAIAATAAAVLIVGAVIFILLDSFYMERAREDGADELYYSIIEEEEHDPPTFDIAVGSIQDDESFIGFDHSDQAVSFYQQHRLDSPQETIVDEPVDSPDDTLEIAEHDQSAPLPETQSPCYAEYDPYRFLSGSLMTKQKNVVVFDSDSNLLLLADNSNVFVYDISDPQDIILISTIELSLSLEDDNATCATIDLRYFHQTLWVTYSYSVQPSISSTDDDPYFPMHFTRVERYDFSEPSYPLLMDTFDMDGRHLATEGHHESMVVITEKHINPSDIEANEYILPHKRFDADEWTALDVTSLKHLRNSEPRTFVIIAYWHSDTDAHPQIFAISGTFNLYQLDTHNMLLIGQALSETASIYVQWAQDGFHFE